MITRRATGQLLASTAVLAVSGALRPGLADQEIKVGIDLSLTGADSESAQRILYGAQLAFNDANAKHAIPGYTIKAVVYDDGTATAGQYDPAQAATNARRMVSEGMVAAVGPMMSGAGKAMGNGFIR